MTDWWPAVAYALTGSRLPGDPVGPEPRALADALARSGWDSGRLAELRSARIAAELPWPVPVPSEIRGDLGPAQLQAVLGTLIDRLGLRSTRTGGSGAPPGPAERRLLADRPPHW